MKNPIALRIILIPIFILLFLFFPIKIYAAQPITETWTYVGLSNYSIYSLAVDPINPSILYAGSGGYGIFKSTNGGATWNAINNGITNYSGYFTDIVVDPTNNNIIYAGGVGVDDGNTGILKSTDSGSSWIYAHNGITDVGFGGPPRDVFSMEMDPNNHNILYVALGWRCGSIYKTINAAGSWTRSVGLPCDPSVVRIDPINSNIIYTRSAQGFGQSIDGGVNWTNISTFGNYGGFSALAIDPFNSNILYANTDIGLYKSTDSGANWAISNGTLNNIYKALVSDPVRLNTLYAGEDIGIETSAYMTINGGSTWTDITNSLPDVGVKRLLVPTNDYNTLYAATEEGIYVYGLTGNTLTVPYFGQNDSPWGQTEYDHASGKLLNPTMDRWGCVVTSVAMILRYHNINEFANGISIDPGSLNDWLKNNNGYMTGYSRDGFYSYFNWPVIGMLTGQLFNAGKSNVKLMHKRAYPSNNTTAILNEDLKKFPDILGVNNSQTSSHFVVAKGNSDNTYSINDPEWNYPTLASFNNSYTQVDRYIPSQTNLSYLVAVVNPSVELLITDPQSNKTGKYFYNNQIQEFNNINNASYSFQAPISNPNDQSVKENLGTGVNEFLLPEPENGKYQIKLSSKKSGFYEINIASFEEEGNNALNKIRGVISSNSDEIIEIDYSQDQVSEIKKAVSFQSLINDINEAKNLNLIKPWIADTLIKLAKSSQKNYDKGRKKIAVIQLNVFENIIKSIRKSPLIKEDAYQILLYDVRYLQNNL